MRRDRAGNYRSLEFGGERRAEVEKFCLKADHEPGGEDDLFLQRAKSEFAGIGP